MKQVSTKKTAAEYSSATIAFRPAPEMAERIRAMAKSETRNVANMVEVLLKEALDGRAKV